MPIYEYVCDACGHQLEALQAISEEPLRECPDCQEAALRKKVSAVAFRLKGGGWYETDFKDRGKRNLAGDSGAAGDGAKSTDSGKTGADSGSSSGSSSDTGKSDSGKSDSSKSDSSKSDSARSDSKPASKPSTGASSSAA